MSFALIGSQTNVVLIHPLYCRSNSAVTALLDAAEVRINQLFTVNYSV